VTIRFNNYAEPVEKKSGYQYFKWKVFIDEADNILDKIESVEYLLHPTFPEPYQVRNDKATKFALTSSGWGEFNIIATVNFKNGDKEKIKYRLDLGKRPGVDNQAL